jgi:ketosteroid isomerase-like protein
MMDEFTIHVETENYRVVGDTGLAWGHYAATTKQKDGPQRTIYQRYAHTFARIDGEWRLVMYHRSLLPTEDMQ